MGGRVGERAGADYQERTRSGLAQITQRKTLERTGAHGGNFYSASSTARQALGRSAIVSSRRFLTGVFLAPFFTLGGGLNHDASSAPQPSPRGGAA